MPTTERKRRQFHITHGTPEHMPFRSCPVKTSILGIPQVGLPHQDLTIQRIFDWCHPLRERDLANDLIAMADTLIAEFEDVARLNSVELKHFSSNDATTKSVKEEALRYKRWYFCQHACNFENKFLMTGRMGLSFRKIEEYWSMD